MQVKHFFVTLLFLLNVLPLGFAQAERPIVRLIYFLPSDRAPQPDIDAKMDRLIKDVQEFFATQMDAHGFGRKTFQFETDARGNAVVHHVKGRFTDEHYNNSSWESWNEIAGRFDFSKNFYLTTIDISSERIDIGGVCGRGGAWGAAAGRALMPASGGCFNVKVAAHELGHAFGLMHDFRSGAYLMAYGSQRELSKSASEWLDAHSAFNSTRAASNDEWPTVEMFPLSLAAPPNAIRLRFKVTDPNGLHQVQLLARTYQASPVCGDTGGGLLGSKGLNGSVSSTVEFVTSDLGPQNKSVRLQAIDVHGNFSGSEFYSIDVTSVLPSPKIVSIPDPTLAAAVREQIGNAITTHTMLDLWWLHPRDSAVTDLTGLEHAHNLVYLELDNTGISDISALADLKQLRSLGLGNTGISDIATLTELTQLRALGLADNPISDISPLVGLTQLQNLVLNNTRISDISALADLKQLRSLSLSNTDISDISVLADLKQLTYLHLYDTAVSDVSALTSLTQLRELVLNNPSISDISVLADLKQLTYLHLYDTAVSDVSVLADLKQLAYLYLNGTAVSDVSALKGLEQLKELDIRAAPLSYASIHTHIPAMQAKGIEVQFYPRTPKTLTKISGDGQQGITNTKLPLPIVVEVRDQHNRVFSGVPVTFHITAGGGRLTSTTTLTDPNGRAQARLTLGQTPGTNTVHVRATDISQPAQFAATGTGISDPVTIPDTNLRTQIIAALGKTPDHRITGADMLTLTGLTANNANIRELTGLQQATNLTTLTLNSNTISDLSLLTGLTQLKRLSLDDNSLRLRDITPLEALPHLETLSLNNNILSEVAPLSTFTPLKTLQLRGNPLSYAALHTDIPAMQAGGIKVDYDARSPTTLVKLSGESGVAGASLPLIIEVQDEQGVAFAGVPVAFRITAGGGSLSTKSVLTDSTGKAQTDFTLGTRPGKNTVRATATGAPRSVDFTVTGIDENSPVVIVDATLRATIAAALSKPRGVQLTAGDMLTLTQLSARDAAIQSLAGLEHAHNLRYLNLDYTGISDIAPLKNLTQLTYLYLSSTDISDISPLADLTHLQNLRLSSTDISDIAALADLTQLTQLSLSSTDISDIAALADLTQLRYLSLSSTDISDIAALADLTQLQNLGLYNTGVSDISPLVRLNLTGTEWRSTGLEIRGAPLSYASIHTHIPAMQARGIKVEFDNVAHPALLKISGDGQEGSIGKAVAAPFVVEVQDDRGRPKPNVTITFSIEDGEGTLNPTQTKTDAKGKARTFLTTGWTPGTITVRTTATGIKSYVLFKATATSPSHRTAADVNGDGTVNIQDLVFVSQRLGQAGQTQADVNGDGAVNIQDLVWVAGELGDAAAAPSAWHHTSVGVPSTEKVAEWLAQAYRLSLTDARSQRGILLLERLLAVLAPKETLLLANYPNPFNPETWIPYQLSEPAEVTLHIYTVKGEWVRTLALGHQPAGLYHSKSRAAYWDGRNEQGERVASGVYFYTLTAGDFTATRKMLIRK